MCNEQPVKIINRSDQLLREVSMSEEISKHCVCGELINSDTNRGSSKMRSAIREGVLMNFVNSAYNRL